MESTIPERLINSNGITVLYEKLDIAFGISSVKYLRFTE